MDRKPFEKKEKARRTRKKPTAVTVFHLFRLVYRSLLFAAGTVAYVFLRIRGGSGLTDELGRHPIPMMIMWVVFVFEMVLRFFPSGLESPGCQKQFPENYIKTGATDIRIDDNNAVFLVALVWIIPNVVLGGLYLSGIIDSGIMVLICSAYSVCDMICILFFCPFQTWFMKNKCCCTCRIYNWDYAMMFTPLFFVRGWYNWSLFGLSIALLIRWEVTFFRHPERFSEQTNGYLTCS
ncbi:MAG: hypothetical protein ILO42_08980, partial [Clostridia bacterium]|nr:hypothetical protein [Clostridia bacterium]